MYMHIHIAHIHIHIAYIYRQIKKLYSTKVCTIKIILFLTSPNIIQCLSCVLFPGSLLSDTWFYLPSALVVQTSCID